MVKAYLRYDLTDTFGVITSAANVLLLHGGKTAVAASLENVSIWNTKQGTQVRARWRRRQTLCCCIYHS